jgi:hypothetical protein
VEPEDLSIVSEGVGAEVERCGAGRVPTDQRAELIDRAFCEQAVEQHGAGSERDRDSGRLDHAVPGEQPGGLDENRWIGAGDDMHE